MSWSIASPGLPPAAGPAPPPDPVADELADWLCAVDEVWRLCERRGDHDRARRLCGPDPRRPRSVMTGQRSGPDPLLEVSPPEYFGALAGVDVPDRGAMIRCPLAGHEDRTPSCCVYSEPADGWFCFGCAAGGSIYDLARELSGIGDRGAEFCELRRWVAERLLGRAA